MHSFLVLRRGKLLLLDPKTGLLYSDVPASHWPELVGRLATDSGTRERYVERIDTSASTGAFVKLDRYLKDQKVGAWGM